MTSTRKQNQSHDTGPSSSIAPALREAIERSVQATCICDRDGRLLAVNEAMAEILVLQRASASYSIFDGSTLTAHALRPHIRTALSGTPVITPPLRYGPGSPNGVGDAACCWLQAYLSPLREADGRVHAVMLSAMDVTELKETEAALRRSEQRLAVALEAGRMGAFEWEIMTGVVNWSPALERLHGYAPGTFPSTIEAYWAEVHPLDRDRLSTALPDILEGKREHHLEYRIIRADGAVRWVEGRGTVLRDDTGRPVRIVGVCSDITDRVQAQRDLQQLAAIVRSSGDAIISKRPDGTITSWNPSAERIFGYSAEEMIGGSIFRLIPEAQHEHERELLRRTSTGEFIESFEATRTRKDGRQIVVAVTISPLYDAAGTVVGASSIKRDVTEHREAEARLRQAAKMEAVGRLAGGMAHDFNNQLHALTGFASFVAQDPGLGPQARRDLAEIQKAAERMATLTRQLLAFSRKQVLTPETLDLNAAIADSQPMLQRLIGSSIELRMQPEPGPQWVRVDRAQLLQILLNLAINARDAMPHGGQLTFRTATRRITRAQTDGAPPLAPGAYAELRVSDTGTGIAPEHLPLIFEPFFTTKGVGQGTGLGLATVHGIVSQSEGHISVASAVGSGTVFTILLPKRDAPAKLELAPTAPRTLPRQRARILVVDDEPAVLAVLGRELAVAGHEVIEAVNGREALRVLGRTAGAVDAIVSDIVMPDMGGRELAGQLARSYPDIPVIWISGFSFDTLGPDFAYIERHSFLQKPVQPGALLDAVHALVAQHTTGRG
ncbi:MAG TPA: PAS domain S-box protein [Gemmatimonadales bacterium]|nr:PAS domain S-box protein [Gemmatimonadales bacterium]